MELILEEKDMLQALESAKVIRDFVLAAIEDKIAQEQQQDKLKSHEDSQFSQYDKIILEKKDENPV